MYKILITCALSQELNIVKEEIKKLKLRNIKTNFLTTGIGNYNMVLNLTKFLDNNNDFDFILNIGVCGYKSIKRDLIQIGRIFNLSNSKELIIPNLIDFGYLSSIASSEKNIYDSDYLEGEEYVDMESYGFEKVCDSFSLPRIVLKVPVDKIGEETKKFDFEKANDLLHNNIDYKLLLKKIINYLEKTFSMQRVVNEKCFFENYKNIFGFTFSENEIFKRLYYRYIALVNNDFDKYYKKNNKLSKKDFLKKLDEDLKEFLVK